MTEIVVGRVEAANIGDAVAVPQQCPDYPTSWAEFYFVHSGLGHHCDTAAEEGVSARIKCPDSDDVVQARQQRLALALLRVEVEFVKITVFGRHDDVAIIIVRAEECANINDSVEATESYLADTE